MKKQFLSILLLFSLLLSLTGCGPTQQEKGEYQVYYLNMDMTKIVAEEYDSSGATGDELIQELLDQLASAPESSKLRPTIPGNVEMEWFQVNSSCLYINFRLQFISATITCHNYYNKKTRLCTFIS